MSAFEIPERSWGGGSQYLGGEARDVRRAPLEPWRWLRGGGQTRGSHRARRLRGKHSGEVRLRNLRACCKPTRNLGGEVWWKRRCGVPSPKTSNPGSNRAARPQPRMEGVLAPPLPSLIPT